LPDAALDPRPLRTPSLFDGIDALADEAGDDKEPSADAYIPGLRESRGPAQKIFSPRASAERREHAVDPAAWDDADTRTIHATLRSGQRVETEHSLVIIGDVNSGAEIIAGGDIVVLGTLRGVAHAGAYDETGGGRVIFALNLVPTQLRIGSVISRGSSEGTSGAEVARVEGNLIVVEPYISKSAPQRPVRARR
jgi:septum site-determining protein MinC